MPAQRSQSQPKGATYYVDDTMYQTNYLDLNLHIDNINNILQQQKQDSFTILQSQKLTRSKPRSFQQDQQKFRYMHPSQYASFKAMTLGDSLACKQFIFPENIKMQYTIQRVAKKIIKNQFKDQLEEDMKQSIKNIQKSLPPKQKQKSSTEPDYIDHLIKVGVTQIDKQAPEIVSPFPTAKKLQLRSPPQKSKISQKQIQLNLGKDAQNVVVSIQFDNLSANSLPMRMI